MILAIPDTTGARFGHVGIYWLAPLVGVTDIDPFCSDVGLPSG
jgi:hypothetical protein